MKIQVTIEMEIALPEESAREIARQIVESKGFNVARVAVPTIKGEGKPFTPRAGKPGSKLLRDGKMFTVWGESPMKGQVWATLEGSPFYWAISASGASSWVEAYHGDGTRHRFGVCECKHSEVAA